MPIRYERDDTRRRVVVTIQGPFALADFLEVIERQHRDDAWTYGILYDLRGMMGEPAIADIRQSLSQSAQVNRPRGPVAILATDPAIYGRACTFATLGRATMTVEVFRDSIEAERWLTAKLAE